MLEKERAAMAAELARRTAELEKERAVSTTATAATWAAEHAGRTAELENERAVSTAVSTVAGEEHTKQLKMVVDADVRRAEI